MEFTDEQVKEALNSFIGETIPKFTNVLELTVFISKISKQLIATVKSGTLDKDEKVRASVDIGKKIVNELENRGVIEYELASEFREVLINTQTLSDMFSTFMTEVESTSKSWLDLFKTCMLGFGCCNSAEIDDKAHTKPMTALEAVLSEAGEDVKEVLKPDTLEIIEEIPPSDKIEIIEEKAVVTAVEDVVPEAS